MERMSSLAGGLERVGFTMHEVMTGTHEFEPGMGPPRRHPMEFRVTWGPPPQRSWLNRSGGQFMQQPLAGNVTIGELCEAAPCEGSLELLYFDQAKIRYRFELEAQGKRYRFVGEKVNIRPWNLPVSHTTCFGRLTEVDGGRLVSVSLTHFRLRTLPAFLMSFRLVRPSPEEVATNAPDTAGAAEARPA